MNQTASISYISYTYSLLFIGVYMLDWTEVAFLHTIVLLASYFVITYGIAALNSLL